jgi:hypothetical protein
VSPLAFKFSRLRTQEREHKSGKNSLLHQQCIFLERGTIFLKRPVNDGFKLWRNCGIELPPLNEGNRNALFAFVLPVTSLLLGGISLASRNFKKRRGLSLLLGGCVIVLFAAFARCAGGTQPPQSQSYSVTVTGASASGALQHSTKVTLTVQ